MLYLDANATSRLRHCAVRTLRELSESDRTLANPSSIHADGRRARAALERAREQVLRFVLPAGSSADLFFTSGGTESCATMLRGFLGASPAGAHIVASSIEHPAVLETLKYLANSGAEISLIAPQADGRVRTEDVLAAVRADTALVTLMAANNETGALQPILELTCALRTARFAGAIVSDCTQALLKSAVDFDELFSAGLNALAFSAHKLGALAGTGGLLINRKAPVCFEFTPLMFGGPQEGRFRAGTENLFGVVTLGAVAQELQETAALERRKVASLRELLWQEISNSLDGVNRITPDISQSISNTLMVQVEGCRGDDLVVALDLNLLATSTGSACASGKQDASHVLQAMGLGASSAREVVRLSLDWDIRESDVRSAAKIFVRTVEQMRSAREEFSPAVGG